MGPHTTSSTSVESGTRDLKHVCTGFGKIAYTEIGTDPATLFEQDLSFEPKMLAAFCEGLGLDLVDLIGNDSGGGIARYSPPRYESRLRSLTFTNCDTHDECPPTRLVGHRWQTTGGGRCRGKERFKLMRTQRLVE